MYIITASVRRLLECSSRSAAVKKALEAINIAHPLYGMYRRLIYAGNDSTADAHELTRKLL